MTTTLFPGYTNAFSAIDTSAEVSHLQKLARRNRKLMKKQKKLKRTIKEQRTAEEKRTVEEQQHAAKATQQNEKSIWSRIGDAVVKAIPAIIADVVPFIMKIFFARRKERRYA